MIAEAGLCELHYCTHVLYIIPQFAGKRAKPKGPVPAPLAEPPAGQGGAVQPPCRRACRDGRTAVDAGGNHGPRLGEDAVRLLACEELDESESRLGVRASKRDTILRDGGE